MHINPAQLGATPCRDAPGRWLLSNSEKQEMTIICTDPANEVFSVTVGIGKLLPNGQSYQLATALTLNKEPQDLAGGSIAYDVEDDSFLYCKAIDARPLNLSTFSNQLDECFATADVLRDFLQHAQEDILPKAIPTEPSSTMNLLIRRKS